MFSSLEALDAPEPTVVARQGVFQPKAKPRARKGAGVSTISPSTTKKGPEVAQKADETRLKTAVSYTTDSLAPTSSIRLPDHEETTLEQIAAPRMLVTNRAILSSNVASSAGNSGWEETMLDSQDQEFPDYVPCISPRHAKLEAVAGGSATVNKFESTARLQEIYDAEAALCEGVTLATSEFNTLVQACQIKPEEAFKLITGLSTDSEIQVTTSEDSPVAHLENKAVSTERVSDSNQVDVDAGGEACVLDGFQDLQHKGLPAEDGTGVIAAECKVVSSPTCSLQTSVENEPNGTLLHEDVFLSETRVVETADVCLEGAPKQSRGHNVTVSLSQVLGVLSQDSTSYSLDAVANKQMKIVTRSSATNSVRVPYDGCEIAEAVNTSVKITAARKPKTGSKATSGAVQSARAAVVFPGQKKRGRPSFLEEHENTTVFSREQGTSVIIGQESTQSAGTIDKTASIDEKELDGDDVGVKEKRKRQGPRKGEKVSRRVAEIARTDLTARGENAAQLDEHLGGIIQEEQRRSKAHVEIPIDGKSARTLEKPPAGSRQKPVSTFAAIDRDVTQPDTQNAANAEPVSAVQESKKKRLMRGSCCRKRRVEKCNLNPADPVKLTMRDLVRLAEAKEKMSKEGAIKRPREESGHVGSNIAQNMEQSQEKGGVTFAPQVQIINGQIVINQESLTVPAQQLNDVHAFNRVEETHSKLNYHSYMKRTPSGRWKAEETELFYKAVEQFGTDFGLIQNLFPGKTRRQVFLKFKKEERKHPMLLADAMIHRPGDHVHFEEVINRLNLSMEVPQLGTNGQSASDSLPSAEADMSAQNNCWRVPVVQNSKGSMSFMDEACEVNNRSNMGVQCYEVEGLQQCTNLGEQAAQTPPPVDAKLDNTTSNGASFMDSAVVPSSNKPFENLKSKSPSQPGSLSSFKADKPQKSKCLFGYQLS